MFIRIIILIFLSYTLLGCKQVYIVSNLLSEEYMGDRDYFDAKYLRLKSRDVLYYIRTGYFNKDLSQLIIFLNYDVLDPDQVFLKKAKLLLNDEVVSTIEDVINNSEKKELVGGEYYFRGGSRLAFNIVDVENFINGYLVLKVFFNKENENSSVDLKIKMGRDRIWPT